MSFVAKLEASVPEIKKPVILSDVGGTLLFAKDANYLVKPNQPLITLLNRAVEQGFEVRLITGGYDSGTWQYDKEKLEKTNIAPEILSNVDGKKRIKGDTYSNVVAVIDDDNDNYIGLVQEMNPNAKHFKPSAKTGFAPEQIEELTRHLSLTKAQSASLTG